ncbi:Nickel and cobalt resistance protein CnrA [wastewater metagenome]|uniref:Nickel and cobalt resistance protein CnrA n=3 Tax=root TaxID=1 RepID=A0A5B8RIH7_9ZZZZ|nr:nickel and cobalt resistance protein CnrA [uncultured organism]
MGRLIAAAFGRSRTVLLFLLIITVMGWQAYRDIPKEAEPDVAIPIIYVSVAYEGISPEDGERLLARPLEKELQSIEGLKEMRTTAAQGYTAIVLEFEAGFDADRALADVREQVDIAKSDLPPGAEEPAVQEVNVALFPVLTVALSGPAPERTLVDVATRLQDRLEALPGILEADIGGDREEVMEIIVDRRVMETYGVSYARLFSVLSGNNLLVAAGALDTGAGRLAVKVPGLVEDLNDVMTLPVKTSGDRVVTFGDVASIRRTYKDPDEFARVDGQPALTLEISKRVGANIIETVAAARDVVGQARGEWPENLQVSYLQDRSEDIRTMLRDLQNNVLAGVILVMVVIIAALGWRPALLVGMAIPGSFLAGILAVYLIGYTMNIVVLFSLILVVGMLVDGAIVVVELAERRLSEGWSRRDAYLHGATRMAWPVISSTATTLAVFLPLTVWPGVVGEFMKYLPITVLLTLSASLAMALVFVPVLGGLIARRDPASAANAAALEAAERGDLAGLRGFVGGYVRMLSRALDRPGLVLAGMVATVVVTYAAYGLFGRGVEFFPEVEPDFAQVQVHARGDLSVWERDALVRAVEERLLGFGSIEHVYARTISDPERMQNVSPDTVGVIQLEFREWDTRPPAAEIMQRIRDVTAPLPGIRVEVRKAQSGPSQGKPIQVRVSADRSDALNTGVERVRTLMDELGGFSDTEDNRPVPGVEWRLEVDRERAARYGADVQLVGNAVQLVTNGVLLDDYRPDDADEEVDIRVRFPPEDRSLETLGLLRVPTDQGQVPIANFVTQRPGPSTGTIERVDGRRTFTVASEVAPGVLADTQVQRLRDAIAGADMPPSVEIAFAGQDEDQREAQTFLSNAFIVAVLFMALILVTQFNSLYQAVLVLSAILFSTAGVLLGLLATQRPFGIVMGGVGMIALAGIVVNNNIVLIDTYNVLRREGMAAREAVLRTAAQRLRPVLLTSVTTVLGLMPMVLKLNVDIIGREVQYNAPSTQWWAQLSSAIAGGLTFATALTLVLTPCLLMLGANVAGALTRRRA